jgi:hypothetical protein
MQLLFPFEISDCQKIKKMTRKLRVAKANLSTSKMNIDFHLQILNNEITK